MSEIFVYDTKGFHSSQLTGYSVKIQHIRECDIFSNTTCNSHMKENK